MRDPPEELSVHLGKDGQEILNELCRTAIHAVSAGRNYKEAKKITISWDSGCEEYRLFRDRRLSGPGSGD